MSKSYRPDIDGLRALAVSLVVLFHAFPTLFPGGFVGVDVFFVISGFLITNIVVERIEVGRFSFIDFYTRRARRIFPALGVVLFVTMVIGWHLLLPSPYEALSLETVSGAFFVPNLLFWSQVGYFDAGAEMKPLLHLWSLGVEEQFYLVWPALLTLAGQRRRVLIAVLVAAVSISLIYSCFAVSATPAAAFYSPASRLWELGAGGLLAVLPLRLAWPRLGTIAGLMLVLIGVFWLDKDSSFPGSAALLPVLGTVMLIASRSRLLAYRPLASFGLISYPLYLWHWPLLSFASQNGLTSKLCTVGIVATSVILAWMTYAFVEKPIRFGNLRVHGAGVAAIGMVSLALTSSAVYLADGLPQRFAPEIRRVMAMMDYRPGSDARYPDCWVSREMAVDAFKAECGEGTMVLWGDSHAARLATGFSKAAEVGLYARDACPPVLSDDGTVCALSNRGIVSRLGKLRPKKVVMFAAWPTYRGSSDSNSPFVISIERAVQEIKTTSREVEIIGPAPYWSPNLPQAAFSFWRDKPMRSRRAAT